MVVNSLEPPLPQGPLPCFGRISVVHSFPQSLQVSRSHLRVDKFIPKTEAKQRRCTRKHLHRATPAYFRRGYTRFQRRYGAEQRCNGVEPRTHSAIENGAVSSELAGRCSRDERPCSGALRAPNKQVHPPYVKLHTCQKAFSNSTRRTTRVLQVQCAYLLFSFRDGHP